MQYLGDYAEDYATLNFKFSTHKADGTPIALAGTPAVSVYKASSTTQSTAGITLSVDFDGVTGLNNVLIDLSADAFYAVGEDYSVVITTGTVNSVSVVGTVLAHFSIENRFQEADVTKIAGAAVSTATAQIGVNIVSQDNIDFGALQKASITEAVPTAADIKTALEADGSKLYHLWETTEDDGGVRRFTANALEEAPSSGSAPTVEQIRAEIDSNSTKLASILEDTGTTIPALINAGAGAGTIQHTYTITDSADGTPIDGVEVWVSTDAAGVNVIASGYTNSSGIINFMLDAGTYYFWRKRSGYNFTNPDLETVEA
jgi:hypothetical protein